MQAIIQALFKYYPSIWYKLGAALILAVLSFLLAQTKVLTDLEYRTLDYRFANTQGSTYPDSSILLISIDNGSLDYFAENGISWPWPRSFYGHMTRYLSESGARIIIFDMLFTHPDADRSETDAEETDGAFAQAMLESGKAIIGAELKPDSLRFSYLEGMTHSEFRAQGWKKALDSKDAELPIDTLLQAAAGVGLTNIEPDGDGIVRRISPIRSVGEDLVPCLALAALIELEQTQTLSTTGDRIRVGSSDLPVDARGDYLINWYGAAGPEGVFRYLPFSAVINSASAVLMGREPQLPAWIFKDKVILIGADAAGLRDLRPTPIIHEGFHPGMEIWATVLSNWLKGDHVRQFPIYLNLLLTLLLAFLILYGFDRLKAWQGYALLVGLIAGTVAFVLLLWAGEQRIYVPIVMPLLAMLLSYLLVFSNEMRERVFLHQVFGAYVAPELMDLMIENRQVPELGGEEIEGTAFFSDLQGFTSLSEEMEPQGLVAFLNEYLTDMTDLLMDSGGTLDKYEGDAILAFFGAPYRLDDHALRAVTAAIAMQERLGELREKWAAEGDRWPKVAAFLNMRIGINSGRMLVGNVGSKGRMNFTMMGDTVNVAARLESAGKQYGVLTHISAATAITLPETFVLRELGRTRLVGKKDALQTFEVMGRREALPAEAIQLAELWATAIEAIKAQEFDQAHKILLECNSLEDEYPLRPTTPSRVYLERHLPEWRKQELDPQWVPIIELRTK